MSIKYCDFTNGDDGTGDGSAGNPYKTITQASIGLTGGDEVRVAKSTASTNLTGTLGFTINSTAVVGSSTLFTSELAIGDFVKGGDDQWYEVIVITDNTHATLFKKYPSATEAGVSSQKLGITSTGAAAASSTAVQTVSVSGSSVASRLKISGGWDLSGTPAQDGQTYFRQMHGTFATRYGYGLYGSSKDYIEIERLHFLRYDRCINMSSCDWWKITSPNLLSAGDEAWHLSSCRNNEIITPVANSSADRGIYLSTSSNNTITTPTCNSNNNGIYLSSSSNNIANKFSGTGNGTDIYVLPAIYFGDYPVIKCQHFKAVGANKCFYEYGITERDTADARSTQCLKYDPTSATYYILQSFFFKADSGVAQTLSAYIKDDADFNGDIQAAIFFMGEEITAWAEWTPTTSYVQKSIIAAAGDITEDGVLELRIKVRGTAGNVFVDDLATA